MTQISTPFKPGFFEVMPGLITEGTIMVRIWDFDNNAAAQILDLKKHWGVEFRWTMKGPAVPILGGHFDLEVNSESLGTGPEFALARRRVPVEDGVLSAPDTVAYRVYIPIEVLPPREGVYAISTHLHFTGTFGGKTAAFVESEEVQFF